MFLWLATVSHFLGDTEARLVSVGDRVWRLSIPWRPQSVEATPAARTSSDVPREAGGPCSRLERLPPELGTGKAEAGGRSQRSTQPFGTSPSRAGDWEGPVSGHWLLGPRKWSPGRAGSKAEGTYPVSCRPGGWSAAWVRGATAAVELEGASTASAGSPHLEPHVGRQM